jgi:phage-related protein
MTDRPQKVDLVFYRTAAGNEPVRDWLLGLDVPSRHAIGMDLMRVQFAWPVGMPLVRPLGDGLFEVRTNLPDKTIARVLFCFHEGELFALHGFTKKTRAAPPDELKLGRKRKAEVENG